MRVRECRRQVGNKETEKKDKSSVEAMTMVREGTEAEADPSMKPSTLADRVVEVSSSLDAATLSKKTRIRHRS